MPLIRAKRIRLIAFDVHAIMIAGATSQSHSSDGP